MIELVLPYKVSKRPVWRLLLSIFAVFLLLGLILWLTIRSGIERRWASMRVRTEQLIADHGNLDMSRAVLRGEALSGNAWDFYDLALSEGRVSTIWSPMYDFLNRRPSANPNLIRKLLSDHNLVLYHMRQGVKRERVHNPHLPEWIGYEMPGLLAAQNVASIAACQARFWLEEGKAREASEILLDTCRFGQDFAQGGPLIVEMIGHAVCSIAIEPFREVLKSDRLAREDLVEIERELEALDKTAIRHDLALMGDVAYMGSSQLRIGPQGQGKGFDTRAITSLECWRYLFSTHLVGADAFEMMDRCSQRAAMCESLPWSQATVEYDRILDLIKGSGNPVVTDTRKELFYSGRQGRERRAQLRLLRIAAHFLATREILELADPFGDKIHHSQTEGALKLWSVGGDGRDDGGTGEWMRTGKDIVLVIVQ